MALKMTKDNKNHEENGILEFLYQELKIGFASYGEMIPKIKNNY